MIFKVILIGPIRAGKSAVGKLLAEKLGLPQCSMDKISGSLYDEIGYDRELAKRLEEQSFYEITKYWKPFEAYAVERLLSEPEEIVIDLGGGHSVL